jgi:hypothetical protein
MAVDKYFGVIISETMAEVTAATATTISKGFRHFKMKNSKLADEKSEGVEVLFSVILFRFSTKFLCGQM